MTSRQLVNFVEAKFRQHGVTKVIPEADVIEQQARRVIEQTLAAAEAAKIAQDVAKRAKEAALPDDLPARVATLLKERPELPCDLAVAQIVGDRAR
jgi:hypothetical protein